MTEDGKPAAAFAAALVDVALFERTHRLRDEFMRLTDALGKPYAAVDPGVAQTEIDEAVAAAHRAGATRLPDLQEKQEAVVRIVVDTNVSYRA